MSAVTQELLHVFQLSLAQLGITVSASLWGGAAGSVLAGVLLDRVGGAFCLRTVRPAMDWRQLDRPSRRLFHGASCSHCVSCVGFAVAILGFPLLQGSAPGAAFLILAAVQSVQIQVVANWYPDTKGVPLGELEL
jgi:MFS family permease